MVRVVVAGLLCLLATACGADSHVFPSGGPARPDAGEFIALGLAGLVAAFGTYVLMRDAERDFGAYRNADHLLRAVLVLCIAFSGVLLTLFGSVSSFGPMTRGAFASVAAMAWGAMLLLHFRGVRRTPRLCVLARVGPLLVVAPMPFFWFAIWVDGDPLIWTIAYAFAIIAVLFAHVTFVAGIPLRAGHRWLVLTTLAGSASSAVVASFRNLGLLSGRHAGSCLQLVFPLAITGTMLVIVCRLRDTRSGAAVAPEPDWPPS